MSTPPTRRPADPPTPIAAHRPVVAMRAAFAPRPSAGDRHRRRTDRFVASVSVRRVGLLRPPALVAIRPRSAHAAAGGWWAGAGEGTRFGPHLPLTLRRMLRRRAAPVARPAWRRRPEPVDLRDAIADIDGPVDWLPDATEPPAWFDDAPEIETEPTFAAEAPFAGSQEAVRVISPLDMPLPARTRTGGAATAAFGGDSAPAFRPAPTMSRVAAWRPAALAATERASARVERATHPPVAGVAAAFRPAVPGAAPTDAAAAPDVGLFGALPPATRHSRPDLLLRAWTGTPRTMSGRAAPEAVAWRGSPAPAIDREAWTAQPSVPTASAASPAAIVVGGQVVPGAGESVPVVGSPVSPTAATSGAGPAIPEAALFAEPRSSTSLSSAPAGALSPAEAVRSFPSTTSPSDAPAIAADSAARLSLVAQRASAGPEAAFDPVRAASFGARLPGIGRWFDPALPHPGDPFAPFGGDDSATAWSWVAPNSGDGWGPLSSPLVRRMAARTRSDGGFAPGAEAVGPFGFWPSDRAPSSGPEAAAASERPTGSWVSASGPLTPGRRSVSATAWQQTDAMVVPSPTGVVARLASGLAANRSAAAPGGWVSPSGFPANAWEVVVQRFRPSFGQPAAGTGDTAPAWFGPEMIFWAAPRPLARRIGDAGRAPTLDRWGATFAGGPTIPPIDRATPAPFAAPADLDRPDAGFAWHSSAAPAPSGAIWRSLDARLAARPMASVSLSVPSSMPGLGVPAGFGAVPFEAAQPSGAASAGLPPAWFDINHSVSEFAPRWPSRWPEPAVSDPWAAGAPPSTLRRLVAALDEPAAPAAPSAGRAAGRISPLASTPTAGVGPTPDAPFGAWTLPASRITPPLAQTARTSIARSAARAGLGAPPVGAAAVGGAIAPAAVPATFAVRRAQSRRDFLASAPGFNPATPGHDDTSAAVKESFAWPTPPNEIAGPSAWPYGADAAFAGPASAPSPIFAAERPSLTLFRSALPHAPEPSPAQVESAVGSLAGSVGRPLPVAVRRSMERAMGADLGLVRVHSGPRVARAAAAVGARAMTAGSDVFLPGGVPDSPRSPEMPLVAHELAHAVGHRVEGGAASGSAPWVRLARKEAAAEEQADGLEAFFGGATGPAPQPGAEPVAMTLARNAAPQASGGPALGSAPSAPAASWPGTASVQRTEDEAALSLGGTGVYAGGLGGSAAAPGAVARIQRAEGEAAEPAPAAAAGGGDDALAERVFKLLQRRLIVERERTGALGRFGRFV